MIPATLNDIFFGATARYGSRPVVMRAKRAGRWVDLSPTGLVARVHRVHAGLRDLGLVAGDRVAILSENRPEWAIADFACLTARLIDVPIYPTLTSKQSTQDLFRNNSGVFPFNTDSHATSFRADHIPNSSNSFF